MFFNVPEARTQLVDKGIVCTLSKKRLAVGKDIAVYPFLYYNHKTLCEIYIVFIKEISSPEELLPYLEESGFKSVEGWLDNAEEGSKYLYRVIKRDK